MSGNAPAIASARSAVKVAIPQRRGGLLPIIAMRRTAERLDAGDTTTSAMVNVPVTPKPGANVPNLTVKLEAA